MLTKRQNLLETIHGGHPDRFVNQYEFIHIILVDPLGITEPYPEYGQTNIKNGWGVTMSWPEGTPGPFPVHDNAHKVVKDIEEWEQVVKAPNLNFPESLWETAIAEAESVNRQEQFTAPFIAPGIFEKTHNLMGIEEALINLYEEPEKMHDLIKYLTDWELEYARTLCDHLHPDAIFHHDDWGSQRSTFFSRDMFQEFFLDAYKEIYGYYRERGVELIVHHSDSYAATLVPDMIDMGVDIWQGVMTTNNIPELIKNYGKEISFMGGINSATVDHPGWTREEVHQEVERACREYGSLYFIPNTTQGLAMSTFEGVYDAVSEEIDQMSKKMIKASN